MSFVQPNIPALVADAESLPVQSMARAWNEDPINQALSSEVLVF
jgi:hypothetical protein